MENNVKNLTVGEKMASTGTVPPIDHRRRIIGYLLGLFDTQYPVKLVLGAP